MKIGNREIINGDTKKLLKSIPIDGGDVIYGRFVERNDKGYRIQNDGGNWTRRMDFEESLTYLEKRKEIWEDLLRKAVSFIRETPVAEEKPEQEEKKKEEITIEKASEETIKRLQILPIESSIIIYGHIVHRNENGYRVGNDPEKKWAWKTQRNDLEKIALYLEKRRGDAKNAPIRGDEKEDVWYVGEVTNSSLLGKGFSKLKPACFKVLDYNRAVVFNMEHGVRVITLKELLICMKTMRENDIPVKYENQKEIETAFRREVESLI